MHVQEQLARAHASVCGVQVANKLTAGGKLKRSRGQGPPTQTQLSGGKVKRNTRLAVFSSVADFVALTHDAAHAHMRLICGSSACAHCDIRPTLQFVAEFVVFLMQ